VKIVELPSFALLLSGEAHIASIPRELQGQALDAGKKIVSSKNLNEINTR